MFINAKPHQHKLCKNLCRVHSDVKLFVTTLWQRQPLRMQRNWQPATTPCIDHLLLTCTTQRHAHERGALTAKHQTDTLIVYLT